SVSVTAPARKRADGSSSNTPRGSPTRPTTRSRRGGGAGAAHAGRRTSARAQKSAARVVRSARRRGRPGHDLVGLDIEAAADRKPHGIGAVGGGRRLQAQPTEIVDVVARRKRAEVVVDHRMWHRIDGARLLDRPCDREERDTNGDRDLRQTRKEGWGPQPARTAPGGGWAECHTDASWSEDRPSLREGANARRRALSTSRASRSASAHSTQVAAWA